MSETSTPTTDEPTDESDVPVAVAPPPATRQAFTVALALAAVAVLIIIQFAFSTANDPQSVNGTTATSSHFIDQ